MVLALRDALAGDDLLLCLALTHARTPDFPAIAAASGYDTVYVDLEHTGTSLDVVAMLCAVAHGCGIAPLVRTPSHDGSLIARVLDLGAAGVIVPHVSTAAEALAVVDAARFPPHGHRSIAGPNPVSGYAAMPQPDLIATLERETVVAVMLETPEAVGSAVEIAAVDGVDLVLIGAHDLTAELGILGQFEDARFTAAVKAVARACAEGQKAFGIAGIRPVELLRRYVGLGLRFISAGTDAGLLTEAASARASALRALSGGKRGRPPVVS